VSFEYIHWTLHAQRRLLDRPGISAADVEAAIRAPDQRVPDPAHPGHWIAHKRLDRAGRPILRRVFYAEAGRGEAVVLSFYRTSQMGRYWRTDQ
jgi:hypothetical protein